MRTFPFAMLAVLALAGLPDDIRDQIDQIGWLLPFLAIIVPVGLICALAFAQAGYVFLGIAQLAAIICGLRALGTHLRRERFTESQLKMMAIPCYLVACFLTNIAVIIAIGVIHKFF